MPPFDVYARARRAMLEAGFDPDFSPAVVQEAQSIALSSDAQNITDLRELNWSSIDNNDSRDLDQIEYAEAAANGAIRLMIAIADVAEYVSATGAIEIRARKNTTSVYTGPQTFPMLPRELSEDRTSLVEYQDRAALLVDMLIGENGEVHQPRVFRALVRN